MVRQVECRGRAEGDYGSIPRRFGELFQCQKCWGWRSRVQDQFWSRLSCVSWEGRRADSYPSGGGTKQRQQNDIKLALERWEDYKMRKKQHKEKEEG